MVMAKPKKAPLYSSKIIKAGALLPDTKMLLAQWDITLDTQANIQRIRDENLFGKASRARVADMLAIFRQRYLQDQEVLLGLIALNRDGAPAPVLDPVLYYLSAQSDVLLRDVVVQVLAPMLNRGQRTIRTSDVERWLREQQAAGRTQGAWSDSTITRIAQGLLATLRDFGILRGSATKRLEQVYLPVAAFAFLALLLSHKQPSGDRLLHDPAWSLYFLPQPAVEQLFFEAHQEKLLTYQAAGRVIRIEFPTRSLEEYAHVVARRSL